MKSLFSLNLLLTIVLVGILFFPFFASAQLVPCGGPDQPCQLCHLFEMIGRIVNFARQVATLIGIVILLAASITLMVSAGKPDLIEKAKKMLYTTVIALVIIYLGWGIVVLLYTALGAAESPAHWLKVCG